MKSSKRLYLKWKLRFIELQIWNLTMLARGRNTYDAKINELDMIYQSLNNYLNE